MKLKLLLIITLISLAGCKTTIPERDSVPPKFTFFVRGKGINEQMEDDIFDFDNKVLYLTRGEAYTVSLIGSDRGGCRGILWELQALPPVIDFPEPLPTGWSSIPTINDFYQISWGGDISDPRTGQTFSTKMIPNGSTSNTIEEIETLIAVSDYRDNEVRKLLTIRIHNDAPRIGPR